MVGTLKRTVTYDPYKGKPSKIPRTITTKLNRLSRQVNAQQPELRQDGYLITVAAGEPLPIPLIVIGSMTSLDEDSTEIRLHRIRVSYTYTLNDPIWGYLYNPKYGATSYTGFFNGGSPWSETNFLVPIDRSKVNVYKEINLSGTNRLENRAGQIITMDQKFSIPKKIRMADVIDQIYYVGGNRSALGNRTMYVTLNYTCT